MCILLFFLDNLFMDIRALLSHEESVWSLKIIKGICLLVSGLWSGENTLFVIFDRFDKRDRDMAKLAVRSSMPSIGVI
jgi:hypothetical protein